MAPIADMYASGDKSGAADAFLRAVNGDEYRHVIDARLPAGAIDPADTDLDPFFQVATPALQEWRLTADDATRNTVPVVSVIGEESAPVFTESHGLVRQWMSQAEELRIPEAAHGLQIMNPRAVAKGLSRFFAQHAI
jgi:3-oxoadipate enol-lactonase